jgi:heme/copper-type cytochrome/quinol oxidase subunit 2
VAQLSTLGVSTTFIFMTRYFIAANIWLVFVVVAILGCTNENAMNGPEMRSFFGKGDMYSSTYTLIVLAMLAVSAFFFVLTWKTRNKS